MFDARTVQMVLNKKSVLQVFEFDHQINVLVKFMGSVLEQLLTESTFENIAIICL